MDKEKLISYIETSFLSPLLLKEEITDISFNGDSVYYVSNLYGRIKSEINIDNGQAKDFIRQISNLAEKQFSYSSPILDVTVGRYRINAVHQSIGKINNDEALTFSVRIASMKPKISSESDFFTKPVRSLLSILISSKVSILIGGTTGSGKTELQKYLIRQIKNNSRIVVIDNVSELEQTRDNNDIDLTFWCADDRNETSSVSSLIRNALRCNPDWLIVAEARGEEMGDVLNSSMTGIPIISTLHSLDVLSMPERVVSMVMMSDKRSNRKEIKNDLSYHIRFYVYTCKERDKDGVIKRYIKQVAELLEDGTPHIIYSKRKNKELYEKISQNNLNLLDFSKEDNDFIKAFVGDK